MKLPGKRTWNIVSRYGANNGLRLARSMSGCRALDKVSPRCSVLIAAEVSNALRELMKFAERDEPLIFTTTWQDGVTTWLVVYKDQTAEGEAASYAEADRAVKAEAERMKAKAQT